ncbi:MAG: hypothetical protein HQ581_11475 [Planctomycetes bacterium]|nr:hypothetical protein [Planctomycetota bacterium]
MDFEERLQKAISRGQRAGDRQARAEAEKAVTEEDFRRMHSQFRLELSEHIEQCVKRLPDHFPGFRFETVVGDRGWGAAVNRDDVGVGGDRRRGNFFSRLEMVVRPFSSYHVLELAAKGTVRNKEIFNRSHYQRLAEVDTTSFAEMIDLWVLEYAELFAAKQ